MHGSVVLDIMVKFMVLLIIIFPIEEFSGIEPINYYIQSFSVGNNFPIYISEIRVVKLHVMKRKLGIIIILDSVFEVPGLIAPQWLVNFDLPPHVAVVVRYPSI